MQRKSCSLLSMRTTTFFCASIISERFHSNEPEFKELNPIRTNLLFRFRNDIRHCHTIDANAYIVRNLDYHHIFFNA